MKHCKWVIFILLVILFPMNTKALMCSNADKVKFQDMAQNITSTYSYVENNGNVNFSITLSNIPEKFIIKDANNDKIYNYTSSEITLNGFDYGKSYRFDIYVDDINCFLDKIYSIYVSLPAYNIYYNDEVCEGIESYKYCNKWQSIPFTYDDFIANVTDYRLSLYKLEDLDDYYSYNGMFDTVIEFYVKYYYIILPAIIMIGLFGIYRYNKKNDLF